MKETYYKYYDGPVTDTKRTLEEIEKDVQDERERCNSMNTWEEIEPKMQETT